MILKQMILLDIKDLELRQETFSRVTSVDDTLTSFTITGVSTVGNVFDGGLDANDIATPISF